MPRKGGYSKGVVGAPEPRVTDEVTGIRPGGQWALVSDGAGQAFGGPGVRLEKPLLLGTPRKTSLQKCLGTGGLGKIGTCVNE